VRERRHGPAARFLNIEISEIASTAGTRRAACLFVDAGEVLHDAGSMEGMFALLVAAPHDVIVGFVGFEANDAAILYLRMVRSSQDQGSVDEVAVHAIVRWVIDQVFVCDQL